MDLDQKGEIKLRDVFYLIHESNGGLGLILSNVSLIERYLEDNNVDGIKKCLESIKKAKTRCADATDYLYNKFKENER